jgi:transcriptional regulator with XRE-family HTH domain
LTLWVIPINIMSLPVYVESAMPGDLDSFMEEVRAESRAAGPEAVAELDAYSEHFEFARQLLELRKARGWTQKRLADQAGVQQSEISRIERGEGNPTFRTLSALARAFEVRLGFVVPHASGQQGARKLAAAAKRVQATRTKPQKALQIERRRTSTGKTKTAPPRLTR